MTKLFCEIVDDPWWFLDEFWWVLVSFHGFSKDLTDFFGFLGAAGPPVAVVPLAFVSIVFCECFKGRQSHIEVTSK